MKNSTLDLCGNHRLLRNNSHDSPSKKSVKSTSADNNTEDGSEDDLDCDEEPPYRYEKNSTIILKIKKIFPDHFVKFNFNFS